MGYPLAITGVRNAELQKWVGGMNVPGVVGKNVFELLDLAIKREPELNMVSLRGFCNDTAGVMMTGLFADNRVKLAMIAALGSNACYFDRVEDIKSLTSNTTAEKMVMVTEWGNIGNDNSLVDFVTDYDKATWDALIRQPGAKEQIQLITMGQMMGGRYVACF